mgnify:CR=1 FL=1
MQAIRIRWFLALDCFLNKKYIYNLLLQLTCGWIEWALHEYDFGSPGNIYFLAFHVITYIIYSLLDSRDAFLKLSNVVPACTLFNWLHIYFFLHSLLFIIRQNLHKVRFHQTFPPGGDIFSSAVTHVRNL